MADQCSDVKQKFEEVCDELNLDVASKDSAWDAYRSIYNDYVLEVSSTWVSGL